MRKTREEKAITLIALIITIVVLLILAVVAINAVKGDGIIQHAVNAKEGYEKAQVEENSIIGEYINFLDKNTTDKKIINFSCEIFYVVHTGGNTYASMNKKYELQAEEGMTWKDWCLSSYNTVDVVELKYNSGSSYIEYNASTWYPTTIADSAIIDENDSYINGEEIISKGKQYSSTYIEE